MINKLGININKEEAKVLLASADLNGDGGLDLQEFHDLIYSTNDALNVDFGRIDLNASDEQTQKLMDNLVLTQQNMKEQRFTNLMKLYAQKNLNNIAMDLLKADEKKAESVSKKEFARILNYRMKLPQSIMDNPEKVERFIDQYCKDETVSYKDFLAELRHFQYKSDCPDVAGSITTYKEKPEFFENQESSEQVLTVLNVQKIPQNQIDTILKRCQTMH